MHSFRTCVVVAATLLALISAVSGAGTLVSGPKIVGYWGCNAGGIDSTMTMLQTALTKGYNVIIYAFDNVDASGNLNQESGTVAIPTKASISTSKTFTYLVSLFGGELGAGPDLSSTTPDAWAQAMYTNFVSLHQMYGFDGIDIDLETWGATPNTIVCGLRAFFKLVHTAGYVVSMAPETTFAYPGIGYQAANWNSYAPLMDTGIIEYVDIVAVQLYNNGLPSTLADYTNSFVNGFQVTGCPTCDGNAVTGFVQVPACKLAFGFPSTHGAANGCSGPFGQTFGGDGCPYGSVLSNFYKSSATLTGTAGLMTWSIEWDSSAGWPFVTNVVTIPFTGTTCAAGGSTVNPSTVSPSTVSPSTVSPSTVSPSTVAPSTVSPSTVSPSTISPSTISPSTISPSTVSPSTKSPSPTGPPKVTVKPATPAPVDLIKTGSATSLTASLFVSVFVSIVYLLV